MLFKKISVFTRRMMPNLHFVGKAQIYLLLKEDGTYTVVN
jgi:hypothetical protein